MILYEDEQGRPLPTFFGIGVEKGGTTSLHEYLQQHPNVVLPTGEKEARYFDDLYGDYGDYDRFLARFDLQRIQDPQTLAWGEITPNYIFWEGAVERIHALAPHAKLIVLLRNPAVRAVSNYWMAYHRGYEKYPMPKVMSEEYEAARIQDNEANRRQFSYLQRGIYHQQLDRVYHYFPANQVLVLRSEDFLEHTAHLMRHITDFLGIPPMPEIEYRQFFVADYPAPVEVTYNQMVEFFRPHNDELTRKYGIDTTEWNIPFDEQYPASERRPQKRANVLKVRVAELNDRLNQNNVRVDHLIERVQGQKDRIDELQKMLGQARELSNTRKERIDTLQQQLDVARHWSQQHQDNANALQRTLEQARQLSNTRKERIDTLQQQLGVARHWSQQHKEKADALQQELEDMEAQIAAKDKEVEQLTLQLEQKKQKHREQVNKIRARAKANKTDANTFRERYETAAAALAQLRQDSQNPDWVSEHISVSLLLAALWKKVRKNTL